MINLSSPSRITMLTIPLEYFSTVPENFILSPLRNCSRFVSIVITSANAGVIAETNNNTAIPNE